MLDSILWTFFLVAFCGIVYLIITYNKLSSLQEKRLELFGEIDSFLLDELSTIETLLNELNSENSETSNLLQLIDEFETLKTIYYSSTRASEKVEVSKRLSSLVKRVLFILNEKKKRGDSSITSEINSLSSELKEIEETIFANKQHYDIITTEYNVKIGMFPTNISAGLLGFKYEEVFNVFSEK